MHLAKSWVYAVTLGTMLSGCISTADHSVETKLKAVIIPEAVFVDARIWDIMQFYNAPIADGPIDPATETILVLPLPVREKIPSVTFTAHQLSLYDSITTVAKLTGLKFQIKHGRAWLIYEDRKAQQSDTPNPHSPSAQGAGGR